MTPEERDELLGRRVLVQVPTLFVLVGLIGLIGVIAVIAHFW